MNYDVLIVGGGPVGMIEACLLKALNKKLNICVLEGRDQATRDFGLQVGSDSVKRVIAVIKKALASQDENADQAFLKDLKKCLMGWANFPSIRTNQIQNEMLEKANRAGISIFKGHAYKVTEDNLSLIFNSQGQTVPLSVELEALRPALSQAKVIIGADGSHSTVRKKVMGNDRANLIEVETYSYALEIKYEIASNSKKKPNLFHMKSAATMMENVLTQSIGKPNPGTILHPVTDLVIVDKEIQDAFIEKNDKGEVVKGCPGKAWSMQELETRAKTNRFVKEYLEKINYQISRTREICQVDPQIPTKNPEVTIIPLSIYKSKKTVEIFENKPVLLVGDASSGLVLRRGFNKGLIEVALSVDAIIKYLHTPQAVPQVLTEIPETLKHYETQSQKTFANEKWWIKKKVAILNLVRFPLKFVFKPIYKVAEFTAHKIKLIFVKVFSSSNHKYGLIFAGPA